MVKRIKATLTLLMQQHLLCFLILNHDEKGVKLNKSIIVKSETMNGNKVLIRGGNMKDIGEGKGVSGGGIMEVPIRVMSIPDPLAA
jgi:hypothetical protein